MGIDHRSRGRKRLTSQPQPRGSNVSISSANAQVMWYIELPGAGDSIHEPSASSLSRQAVPRRRLEILEEAQVVADYALATELEDAIGHVGRRN
jgi:hypothetical protein